MKNLSKRTRILMFSLVGILVLAGAGFLLVNGQGDLPLSGEPTGAPIPEAPASLEVTTGDEVLVTIKADAVENMYGYQFQLHYDPEALAYAENDVTSELGDFGFIFDQPFEDYTLVGATMTGDQAGLSGTDQVLCHLKFTMLTDTVLVEDLLCQL